MMLDEHELQSAAALSSRTSEFHHSCTTKAGDVAAAAIAATFDEARFVQQLEGMSDDPKQLDRIEELVRHARRAHRDQSYDVDSTHPFEFQVGIAADGECPRYPQVGKVRLGAVGRQGRARYHGKARQGKRYERCVDVGEASSSGHCGPT